MTSTVTTWFRFTPTRVVSFQRRFSAQSGKVAYTNCSAYAPSNPGCRVETNGTSTPTWGRSLNRAGGGLIAMERSFGTTGTGVRVWYSPPPPPSPPTSLPPPHVNTSNWPTPNAYLPIASCYADFAPHKIIFDITLCGDWAGNTYNRADATSSTQRAAIRSGITAAVSIRVIGRWRV